MNEAVGVIVHELKCWPEPFAAIRRRDKKCEVRKNDRNFKVGDYLRLMEWKPPVLLACDGVSTAERPGTYTGEAQLVRVTHIQEGFGIPEGYVVMSII